MRHFPEELGSAEAFVVWQFKGRQGNFGQGNEHEGPSDGRLKVCGWTGQRGVGFVSFSLDRDVYRCSLM